MANEVFANGMEIACQAADGKSVACFPDPCWSPPGPPAGPIVIPYPNTAYAKDLANASTTVFISGRPVAQKNKSYFKTSTGNEPATRAFPMGVISGTIRGKAYFASWSMDVKVEGLNVCRHLDLMTHNHGSVPGNTPPWAYVDSAVGAPACAQDRAQANAKCTPSSTEEDEFRHDQERANKRRIKRGKRAAPIRNMGWKDKHCTGLMRIKPYTNIEDTASALEEALADAQDAIDNLDDILIEKGLEIAANKLERVGERAALKYVGSLFGGPLAPFLAAVSTAVTIVDGVYSTVTGAMDAYDVYRDIETKLGPMQDLLSNTQGQLKRVQDGLSLLEKAKNGTLTKAEAEQLQKVKDEVTQRAGELANAQAAQSAMDPCLRALKCTLTPFEQRQGMQTTGSRPQLEGCCPGQTGHHLPPKAYFSNCPEYAKDKALVVCAEGVDQRSGSHGRLHDVQDQEALQRMTDGTLSFDDAIEASLAAHEQTFLASGCNTQCLRTQLKESLKRCEGAAINPVNKEGGALVGRENIQF